MELEEGLDTGPIYAEERLTIDDGESADELRARLVDIGARLLVDTLSKPLPEPRPQVGEPTYAAKIEPSELRIDWSQPADDIDRLVRATGRAWTTFRGARLRILGARPGVSNLEPGLIDGVLVGAGRGALELVEVQPEGKGPQPVAAWRNGARLQPGERFE
jgi:methionyl-tRNA formyltransferase